MASVPNDEIIYKILTVDQWREAKQVGRFDGAPVDLADGYIHFSRANQVEETAAKHFTGQQNLLLVGVKASAIAADLRYDVSRGGDLFPHLYGALPLAAVTSVDQLELGPDGLHCFPDSVNRVGTE